MTRSTASRLARNSDSLMIGGRRRPDSRPSRRRWRLASSRVEPLTARTSSGSAAGRGSRAGSGAPGCSCAGASAAAAAPLRRRLRRLLVPPSPSASPACWPPSAAPDPARAVSPGASSGVPDGRAAIALGGLVGGLGATPATAAATAAAPPPGRPARGLARLGLRVAAGPAAIGPARLLGDGGRLEDDDGGLERGRRHGCRGAVVPGGGAARAGLAGLRGTGRRARAEDRQLDWLAQPAARPAEQAPAEPAAFGAGLLTRSFLLMRS